MTLASHIAKFLLLLAIGFILWVALSANPPRAGGLFDLDKLNHFGAFFVLAALTDYAFLQANLIWQKMAPLLCFGLSIEVMQYGVGYRYFEWLDLIADAAGLLCFLAVRGGFRSIFDPLIHKCFGAA